MYGIWALKPCDFGAWTPRGIYENSYLILGGRRVGVYRRTQTLGGGVRSNHEFEAKVNRGRQTDNWFLAAAKSAHAP